jgi:hypothetical protein
VRHVSLDSGVRAIYPALFLNFIVAGKIYRARRYDCCRMADIVNFNKARKRKARQLAAKTAAENRVRFGRSKADKQREAAELEAARRRLDQLHREPPEKPHDK